MRKFMVQVRRGAVNRLNEAQRSFFALSYGGTYNSMLIYNFFWRKSFANFNFTTDDIRTLVEIARNNSDWQAASFLLQ